MKSIDFKVKRHWWIWALAIAFNLFAVQVLLNGIYRLFMNAGEVPLISTLIKFVNSPQFIIFAIIFIADILVIRDASHINYNLDDKFLTVQFAVFSNKVIPLISVLAVDGVSLMSFQGFGVHIIESSAAAYKITYRVSSRKRKSIIVSPKDKELFIKELGSRIDKNVILLNSKESAFKKKKD